MDIAGICRFLAEEDSFLLTTHESPDGDGLAAEYALYQVLQELGKDVIILNSDAHAGKYDYFDPEGVIRNFEEDEIHTDDFSNRHLIILDTDPSNLGCQGQVLLENCSDVTVIDHHSSQRKQDYTGWLSSETSSTCEMIFLILKEFKIELTLPLATALYSGIVYDTGSFIYPKTRSRTFAIAEELVSAGVVPNDIYTRLYENKSTGALMLQSLVSSTMILHGNDRVAVQVMPRETLIASGASYEESQEIVSFPLQCAAVRVSVFFKESEDGGRRCSMRSKGEVDCAAIAHIFGGGGHKTAAGFSFEGSFQDTEDRVLEEIRRYLT